MALLRQELRVDGRSVSLVIDVGDGMPGGGVAAGTTRDLFGESVDVARACAARAASSFGTLSEAVRPDEVEVKLSLQLDGQLGPILTRGGEGHVELTLRWKLD